MRKCYRWLYIFKNLYEFCIIFVVDIFVHTNQDNSYYFVVLFKIYFCDMYVVVYSVHIYVFIWVIWDDPVAGNRLLWRYPLR